MLQALPVAAAEVHAGPVQEHDPIVAVVPWLDFANAVDVDQVPAVYPDEAAAIELPLQRGKRLASWISGALGVDIDLIAVRLDPIDIGDGDHVFTVQLAYDEALERRICGGELIGLRIVCRRLRR